MTAFTSKKMITDARVVLSDLQQYSEEVTVKKNDYYVRAVRSKIEQQRNLGRMTERLHLRCNSIANGN